jgi:mannosyltransferase OCH1-like enzyme
VEDNVSHERGFRIVPTGKEVIPRVIHQVWVGRAPIPNQYAKWSEILRAMNPAWDYRFHRVNDDNLKERFFSPASQSNWVRLEVVKKWGGVYLDMDMEPLKPLDSLIDHQAFAACQDGDRLCNAVFGAEPNHPWVNWQLGNIIGDRHDAAWGVYTMSAAPREGVAIIPPHLVYPWHYDDPPHARKPHPESILVHHWAGSWT